MYSGIGEIGESDNVDDLLDELTRELSLDSEPISNFNGTASCENKTTNQAAPLARLMTAVNEGSDYKPSQDAVEAFMHSLVSTPGHSNISTHNPFQPQQDLNPNFSKDEDESVNLILNQVNRINLFEHIIF